MYAIYINTHNMCAHQYIYRHINVFSVLLLYLVWVQGEVCIQQLPGVVVRFALVDLVGGVSDLYVHGPVGHPLVLEALGPTRYWGCCHDLNQLWEKPERSAVGREVRPRTRERKVNIRALNSGPLKDRCAGFRHIPQFSFTLRETFMLLWNTVDGQRDRQNQNSDERPTPNPAHRSRHKANQEDRSQRYNHELSYGIYQRYSATMKTSPKTCNTTSISLNNRQEWREKNL